MESIRQDDSKALNEENDKQDLVIDDMDTTRSYQCVFCKRGFTTAQALGGHMNIHRRDRARNKKPTIPSNISNRLMEEYTRSGLLQPFTSHSQVYSSAMETQRNYQMNFVPSTSSTAYQHGYHNDNSNIRRPRSLKVFEDDWRASLSLRIGPTDVEDKEEEQEEEEEDQLDLELRLGHDP